MGSSKTNDDVDMPDAPASDLPGDQQTARNEHERDLDREYPYRPKNKKGRSLPFHELITDLFDPLNENRKKPGGPPGRPRNRVGPHGPFKRSPQEERRLTIERFFDRWRSNVGDDFFPLLRLIIPEKDRDRALYGLKETNLAKVLAEVMGVPKNGDDYTSMIKWKVPGKTAAARMAGDFAGRCYEQMKKRPRLTDYGEMTIEQVNTTLDELSQANGLREQEIVLRRFYNAMNPTELMWLIRIILKQMKIGATERTFFDIFHYQAQALFSANSNLRKVCYMLCRPDIQLDDGEKGVQLMECYQPQLAQFQMHNFERMVGKVRPPADGSKFWIEEKLDGERIQMHMMADPEAPGDKKFAFWSRKAKDFTYLYGDSLRSETSALSRFLRDKKPANEEDDEVDQALDRFGDLDTSDESDEEQEADKVQKVERPKPGLVFHPGVNSIVLDGEMIEWDARKRMMVPFGTLKTAALDQARNPFSETSSWPLYRVFDILYLNGKDLTGYTLRDRRKALLQSVRGVKYRLEIHPWIAAISAGKVERCLMKIHRNRGEGLVIKNPESSYRLNDRNWDWLKVKPEYMNELGENVDCLIIGAYYGSGRRANTHSSFLCGLLAPAGTQHGQALHSHSQFSQSQYSQSQGPQEVHPQRVYSFFKCGGGFMAGDYAQIRHVTDGKWRKYSKSKPPGDVIELGGGKLQYEAPDEWIMPEDSIVIQVKAASITYSDQFRSYMTLRFPRFVKLRGDKSWKDALTVDGFKVVQAEAEKARGENKDQKLQVFDRRKRVKSSDSKKIKVAGGTIDDVTTPYAGPATKIFEGLTFYIMSDQLQPRKTKPEIEQFVKANGGAIRQTHDAAENTICVSDRQVIRAAGRIKANDMNIIRPKWLFDCVKQSETDVGKSAFLLPFEPGHMFFTHTKGGDAQAQAQAQAIQANVDEHGDSYTRDVTAAELKEIFSRMETPPASEPENKDIVRKQLEHHGHGLGSLRGRMFEGQTLYFEYGQHIEGSNSLGADVGHAHASAGGEKFKLDLARMTARFAAANVTDNISDLRITQIVSGSRGDEESKLLRERIAQGRRKLPRIVSPEWVLDSWDEETLLAEERYAV